MNYIFEVLLKMLEEEKRPETIKFVLAKEYSAYLELAQECLNQSEIEEYETIEINPYFRYHEMFKSFFGDKENMELKNCFLDIVIHINFLTDRLSGMDKYAFYLLFVQEACQTGVLGNHIQKNWNILNRLEQKSIAKGILESYQSGDTLEILREMFCQFFPKGSVYFHHYQKQEILVYTAVKKSNIQMEKTELLKQLFLPFDYNIQIYWKNHFGIIDIDETMMLNILELY